jgi:hypothetical protein
LLVLSSPSASAQAALPNGGVVSGSIAIGGQQDNYVFFANAGEGIQLQVARTSGTWQPRLSVLTPSGTTQVGGSGAVVASVGVFKAPVTGTYSVIVSAGSPTSTGSYNLYFTRAPGANEAGTTSTDGQALAGTIDIGDLDSFAFSANAGEGIQIQVGRTSGALRPLLRVFGPGGGLLVNVSGIVVAYGGLFNAPSTGTYTVVNRPAF